MANRTVMHVDVLDGVRAFSVLAVAWFHIWQQSWLQPYFDIAGIHIGFEWLATTGYVFVDVLILLSGFCLFLPYARTMSIGPTDLCVRDFFIKRASRILPSYWLNLVVVLVFFALPENAYEGSAIEAWRDIAAHLTFTHTFWAQTYMFTKLNAVLWTLAVEVQFYLLFPALAWCFCRRPWWTYLGMVSVAFGFRGLMVSPRSDIAMLFNQLPNFFDVYANGMAGAVLFWAIRDRLDAMNCPGLARKLATLAAMGLAFWLYRMLVELSVLSDYNAINAWQSENRFVWSALVLAFILAAAFSMEWFRGLWSNRWMGFMSAISYNYFIWHQYLAVQLKKWHFPPAVSAEPYQAGEHEWQVWYTIVAFCGSLVLATCLTYGYEQPVARWIKKRFSVR